MPELPEVETVAAGMKPLEGQSLRSLRILDDKVWFESEFSPEEFKGERLREVSRRGKYILYRFSSDKVLVQHLRMTGKMLEKDSVVIPQAVRTQMASGGEKARQARALFTFSEKEIVFFDTRRFGTLTAVRSEKEFFRKKSLAPDPIYQPDEAKQAFFEKLQTNRPIKATLLDQSVIAGVGNIYADEALFSVGLHPLMPTNKLKRKEELWNSILKLFHVAIASGGTSILNYVNTNGESGKFSNFLNVYGKAGEACPRCKSKIRSQTIASRTSHFCHKCQKRVDQFLSKKRSG